METTELHLAFMWDCNNCGTENFVRCISQHLDVDNTEEVREHEDEVGRDYMLAPERVTCSRCGAEFKTVNSEDFWVPKGEEDDE